MRHTIEEYRERAIKLITTFDSNEKLYLFTTKKGFEILNVNNTFNKFKFPHIKIMKNYQNIYDIPKFRLLKAKYDLIYSVMNRTEPYIVSSEIGAIWNAKIYFIQLVIESLEPQGHIFFWIDLSIFKTNDIFEQRQPLIWPYDLRINKIFTFSDKSSKIMLLDRMLFVANPFFYHLSNKNQTINLRDYEGLIAAGLFGGTKSSFLFFIRKYWKLHDDLILKNQYVLREEFIIALFCRLYKNNVFFINFDKPGNCYIWHSFVAFLSKFNVCSHPNSILMFNPSNLSSDALISINLKTWI